MKKSILITGLLLSTIAATAQPLVNVDNDIKTNTVVVQKETLHHQTNLLKMKAIKLQLKNHKKGLNHSVRLLQEMNKVVSNFKTK